MKKFVFLPLVFTLILLSSCIFFQNINQPSKSLPNDIVTVSFHATTEGCTAPYIYEPYFGICIPDGWTIPGDSVKCNGVYNNTIYYDDSLSLEQEGVSPAPVGYYWWVGKGVAVSTVIGNVYAVLSIKTDNQTGLFAIDYMLGSSTPGQGLNQERSDNHQIEIVDDEYSPRRFQAAVEGNSVRLNWSEPLNTSGLIGYNIYRDEEKINTSIVADTIFYDANPVEGIHYYKIATYYNNGNEYMIPYDKSAVYQSIYVSPNGSNANNGSSFNDALQTIDYTMSVIRADSLHPITIFLAPGYFSPLTNEEQFPITCLSYVSLIGSGEDLTFLYADDQKTVLQFVDAQDIITGGLTISSGNIGVYCSSSDVSFTNLTISDNAGRGINCQNNSNPSLENVTVTDNNGGGINCSNSTLDLANVNITDNTANIGGGIYCDGAALNLANVLVTHNTAADSGGGIMCLNNSILNYDGTNGSSIYLNQALFGNDLYSDTLMNVVVDTFTVLSPTSFHTYPIENFTFDILQGKIIQAEADLFVSPNGDDTNSGLTETNPLKTIYCAFAKILSDSLHPHSINLLEGTYSQSSNGEHFPLNILDYVSLFGQSDSTVFLDAEGSSNVIRIYEEIETIISDLTVTGGSDSNGGGIYCASSNASFNNLVIKDNGAGSGGGIHIWHSNPSLYNVIISGNYGTDGAGIRCYYSDPSLENIRIESNTISDYGDGGGMELFYSNPSLYNVIISDNYGGSMGGGIYSRWSNPELVNVTIRDNFAGAGGGIYAHGSHFELVDVTIAGNSAGTNGGGGIVGAWYSSLSLINSIIINNSSDYNGGGIIISSNVDAILENVIIMGNIAYGGGGGGIYCTSSNTNLLNVTMTGNSAGAGGGIYCRSGGSPILKNCILWNDSTEEIYFYGFSSPNTITFSYSDIQGGEAGIITNGNGTINWLEGNIVEDPLFAGTGDYPYILSSGSPCIDAGNPDTVYNDPEDPSNPGYALWPAMGTIRNDMGAYGGPNAASWNIVTGIEDDDTEELQSPTEFELAQNYPNPFNPSTTIQYGIKERSPVELVLYDILGSQVVVLVNEEQDAGYYKVNFNAVRLASGIYFYRIQAGSFVETKKMVLLK